jgi:hypothetical protein
MLHDVFYLQQDAIHFIILSFSVQIILPFFIIHALQSNTKPIIRWSMPLGVSDNHSVLKGKQDLPAFYRLQFYNYNVVNTANVYGVPDHHTVQYT